jgi:flagellar biosynthetic protein FliR
MHTEFTLPLSAVWAFVLVLARVSGLLVMAPIPGLSAAPDLSRVVLAVVLTVALFPSWPVAPVAFTALSGWIAGIASEAAFGLTIGVAIAFLLEGVQLAAQMIGLQAGYSYASTVDPSTEADTTTLQVMAQLLAGWLFFAFGLDRQVVRVLARSLASIPAGSFRLSGPVAEAVTRLGAGIFKTGLQLALPVLALSLLVDVAFAVLGRLHSQLQLLSLAFAAKMLVGIAFLTVVLRLYPAVFEQTAAATLSALVRILNP